MADRLLKEAADLYNDKPFLKLFSQIRIWDAPYEETEKLVPQGGLIVDLGCGDGLFANYLSLKSTKRKVIGIDANPRRISQADRGLTNTKFIKGDALKTQFSKARAIVMYHLLHHLDSFKKQELLLGQIKRFLEKGGELVIVEIDKKFSFKFLVTWIVDRFIYPMLFDQKFYEPKIFFRTRSGWKNLLTGLGYKTRVIAAEKGKPFTHIIIVCKK